MIKCKDAVCPVHEDNRCCHGCVNADTCEYGCKEDFVDCKFSIKEESTELTLFQSKALETMQKIADLDLQKKQLEAQDKVVRQRLQELMDQYGVKTFENDILKITYVEPTTRSTIDSKKLREDLPAVAEKYTKVSPVKGSVRIEVK